MMMVRDHWDMNNQPHLSYQDWNNNYDPHKKQTSTLIWYVVITETLRKDQFMFWQWQAGYTLPSASMKSQVLQLINAIWWQQVSFVQDSCTRNWFSVIVNAECFLTQCVSFSADFLANILSWANLISHQINLSQNN